MFDWSKIFQNTKNLTYRISNLILAGKMTEEFDKAYKIAEAEGARKEARKNAEDAILATSQIAEWKRLREYVVESLLPKLEQRNFLLWESGRGKLILELTHALIRKIEANENRQDQELSIEHVYSTRETEAVLLYQYNDKVRIQRQKATGYGAWLTHDPDGGLIGAESTLSSLQNLQKYKPSDLLLEASVEYGSGEKGGIGFSFKYNEAGIVKFGYGFCVETIDINKVDKDTLAKIFVDLAIHKEYLKPYPSYDQSYDGGNC
jgi:hypothetical protein